MAQIRITPEELREGASFIQQKEEAINQEVAALKAKIDEITGNWEGAAQSSFIETFESDMYPIMKDTLPEVLEGIASQMNGAADALEQADEEIANAFRG
ncbi:MAG: WXG100 family type VII secretion target [Pseudobutyrivibrio sp.]|uniref:WXG100 family type VII secretion target n=1 Tax=Pseudobutyrivibrio sp. TaxID=2014367 RepID=UPI0025FB1C2B|nr:WXG100 family type VII secretion target [Pseudobutyrivibrio sp.]MBQ8489997.1 WXG100 family type VII secretion target [Pseudobutyrivibrio sp.]